jgi:hypothetical protein
MNDYILAAVQGALISGACSTLIPSRAKAAAVGVIVTILWIITFHS